MQDLGLPPFTDFIQGAVPMQPPWTMQGTVVKGFGRGSKDLGIPTANLDSASLQVSPSCLSYGACMLGSDDLAARVCLLTCLYGWPEHRRHDCGSHCQERCWAHNVEHAAAVRGRMAGLPSRTALP